ncbi:MAG: YraN family protein [Candidatus Pacebacteria bacterium]|nr:YraN family protein [Candidatus Paceibacterota bacterium]
MKAKSIGYFGEEKAALYLQNNHYEIIQRNFRKKWGEIDIIAKDKKTKEIVFIEVKARKTDNFSNLMPEEALTIKKIRRLKRIFLSYLNQYDLEDSPWRFDFIAVETEKNTQDPVIRHYKDILLEF